MRPKDEQLLVKHNNNVQVLTNSCMHAYPWSLKNTTVLLF